MDLNQRLLDKVYNQFYSATLNGYLVKNYRNLFHLIDLTDSFLYFQKSVPFEEHFSEEDTVNLEREFLTSLKPNYGKQFDRDYKNRRVISKKGKRGNYYVDRKRNYYKIYYPKTFYIEAFEILTHEYTHHLSYQFPRLKEESSSYTVYCEMLSMLGELKGIDFLQDFGISEQEIEIYKNNRLKELKPHFEMFLFIEPLLHIFLSSNRLTENHINELLEKIDIIRH